jgi:hypothetical protein
MELIADDGITRYQDEVIKFLEEYEESRAEKEIGGFRVVLGNSDEKPKEKKRVLKLIQIWS